MIKYNVKTYWEAKEKHSDFFSGNPKSKLPNKRELVGYVPMEKRVTALMAAGIRTAAQRDQEFFDTVNSEEIPDMPPLPRHIPADLAEVSDLARQYAARRREIEAKLVDARERRLEAERAALANGSGGPPPAQPPKAE